MGTLHRMGAGLLVLTLAGGLAACGDDSDSAADPTTTTVDPAEAQTAAFCSGIVDLNDAVNGVELDETSTEADVTAAGESLAAPLEDITANAPDAVADDLTAVSTFVDGMVGGDAAAFNDEAAFTAYSTFLTSAIAECPFGSVPVTAVDYAFEDVPETVDAGTTAFILTNASEGNEDHEMIVMRKGDDVALSFDEILALPEEESDSMVEFKGAGFAPNGGPPGTVLADLTPGSYVMLCFLPIGGAEDGAPHFTQGMKQEFTVE